MKLIKKLLFKVLPQSTYLKLLHRSFYLLYDLNLLKNKKSFKYHYMVKEFIKDGDIIIDIGANLGYFSKTFARMSPSGKVICIEPLPQYYAGPVLFPKPSKKMLISIMSHWEEKLEKQP